MSKQNASLYLFRLDSFEECCSGPIMHKGGEHNNSAISNCVFVLLVLLQLQTSIKLGWNLFFLSYIMLFLLLTSLVWKLFQDRVDLPRRVNDLIMLIFQSIKLYNWIFSHLYNFFSKWLLPEEERGRSQADSHVDIVRTGTWEGIVQTTHASSPHLYDIFDRQYYQLNRSSHLAHSRYPFFLSSC